jgi:hypothetical protein
MEIQPRPLVTSTGPYLQTLLYAFVLSYPDLG